MTPRTQGIGAGSDTNHVNEMDRASDNYNPAYAGGHRNGSDIASDAYHPSFSYNYRNEADKASDDAYNARLAREANVMELPSDYKLQPPGSAEDAKRGEAILIGQRNKVIDAQERAERVARAKIDAARAEQRNAQYDSIMARRGAETVPSPFAGRSTITDVNAYEAPTERERRLMAMSNEAAEKYSTATWRSAAREWKALQGKSFTYDSTYNGLALKGPQLDFAAGNYNGDALDLTAGIAIEAGLHTDMGRALGARAGDALGTAIGAMSKRPSVATPQIGTNVSGGTVGTEIPWSSKSVRDADKSLGTGRTEVTVANRSEAEELFLARYQGNNYRNVSGLSPRESKELFGTKSGSYHWDIGAKSHPHDVNHLQVHTHEGQIIRIYFK